MVRISSLLACASLLLSSAFCAPFSPNAPVVARNTLAKRTEPSTGDDDFPDVEPHPNELDKVEGAFHDAVELISYALDDLKGKDNTIFLHYFNEGDKDNVRKVFETILGQTTVPLNPSTGNEMLKNLHVQKNDVDNLCGDGRTLAYTSGHETDTPYIVLCPNAFKKKGVTAINGAENPADNPDDAKFYIDCDELAANGHVSYLMNSLGATLLHEYTHYDNLIKPVFGKQIVDQPDGYGPVNVYNKLDKGLALTNSDSYMYYSLEVLWTVICTQVDTFQAPRPDIDDADPDCGKQVCKP